jgi:hypothetical protein
MSGELVVRVHRLVCRTGRPGRFRGDPDTLAESAFMRYVGPLTGADRAEHYVALARLERSSG